MRNLRNLLLASVGAVSAFAVAAPAFAAVQTTATQNISIGSGTPSATNGVPTDWPGSVGCSLYAGCTGTFQTFNSNLGTLLSINIVSTMQIYSTIVVTPVTASYGSVQTFTEETVGDTTSSAINSVIKNLVDTTYDPANPNNYGAAAIAAKDYYGSSTNPITTPTTLTAISPIASTGLLTDTTSSDLAPFSTNGSTTQTVNFTTLTQTAQLQSGGNAGYTQTTNGVGTFAIYYTYDDSTATPPSTPVPEPASFAVLGAGLLGLGLFRRRRV